MWTKKQSGFTLVEMVIAVAILALMSSIAMLGYSSMVSSYRLRKAATLLTGAIREAQFKGLQEGRQWRVLLGPDSYQMQYATSATAAADCGASGWQNYRNPEPFGAGVAVQSWSRSCVSFDPTGRGNWPNGQVESTEAPYSAPDFPRLLDGQVYDKTRLIDPRLPTSGTVTWGTSLAQVHLSMDLEEARYLSTVCIGAVSSRAHNVKYPSRIRIKATLGDTPPSDWNTLATIYDSPGPADPPSGVDRTCVSVPLNASYRFLYIILDKSTSSYMSLDEIDASNLVFTLGSVTGTRQVIVTPVTGRVQSK